MNYPIWIVPGIGGPWVIGIIAIIHVFLSHFAVGGGAFLALAEWLAYKRNDSRLYDYVKSHSRFFVLVTTVAGAATGVAIWFSISLVSPDGTASLIQSFTLAWALEYLFFVAELATAFAYYYSWDKISKEKHLLLAKWYFAMSVMTLAVINGILTFMLTPGQWLETRYWLHGVLNETYFPSLVIRLLIMFAIAGMYALVTATRIKDEDLRVYVVKFCAKWLLPVFFLGPIASFWYLSQVPQVTIETIFTGIQSSGVGNFSVLARALYLSLVFSGTILVFAYFGPYLNPKGFTFKIALLFMLCGFIATGSTEWMREMLRKPYVVYNYMYSNGIRKSQVEELRANGFLTKAKWANATNPNKTDTTCGEKLFQYQCMACHTVDGYRSMKRLIGERDEDSIISFLKMMDPKNKENPYKGIMPPFAGTEDEAKMLAKYLAGINKTGETQN